MRMPQFYELSLKNKILFSSVAVIILVSMCIALVARYILISSLERELEFRGLGIGQSIADRAPSLILTKDKPNLISLVFESAQVGERRNLVSYIFIMDTENVVLASTFIQPFPDVLRSANPIPAGQTQHIKLIEFEGESAYDVAVPVKEGIYDIGSVHVGISKEHIDNMIGKLRFIFLGFIACIMLIMFIISDRLSRNMMRPIAQLMKMADEISRDNLDFEINFSQSAGLEVLQLADSFRNMVRHIKEYRTELKKSQQKYRSLFYSGPDPIFVLDCHSLDILDANPVAADIYGFPRKELVGKSFSEISEEFTTERLSSFASGGDEGLASCIFFPKAIHYRKGRDPFIVNVHACGTIYEDKPAIIVSTNDITDMIEKDAQLIQASKMKTLGEMSAGIAHEINQPLNAIKIGSEYLNLLAQRGGTPPMNQLQKVVTEISKQVDRAAEIITTLREFGRKADLTKDKFDISKPLRGVLNILGQQFKLENIELKIDLSENLPKILAHSNRLEQVLFNLVSNARDAINMKEDQSDKSPRIISIKTFGQDGRVCISVADTGTGIPESKLDKIFEPFYTTKEVGKGMGLGLAISFGIVRDYQGDIKVVSEHGKGAVFTLSFPAA
jgi:histidine kinase